jgi:hypothetical protein
MDDPYYESKKEAARRIYVAHPVIRSPFFNDDIILRAEGFRHLLLSAHGERTKAEQIQRFILLPLAIHILKTASTRRTYRKQLNVVHISGGGCLKERRVVQWWSFVAFFVKQDIKVRVVVRKVGDERLEFWGVMLDTKRSRRAGSRIRA